MENHKTPSDTLIQWFESLYGWQCDFIGTTASYSESCLCAANQIGKTYLGTGMDAVHALGDYPPDWPGHEFTAPPLIWCLGYSGEKNPRPPAIQNVRAVYREHVEWGVYTR